MCPAHSSVFKHDNIQLRIWIDYWMVISGLKHLWRRVLVWFDVWYNAAYADKLTAVYGKRLLFTQSLPEIR